MNPRRLSHFASSWLGSDLCSREGKKKISDSYRHDVLPLIQCWTVV